MLKVCMGCGNEFSTPPGAAHLRKYCSKQCRFPKHAEEHIPSRSHPSRQRHLGGQTFNGVLIMHESGRRNREGRRMYMCRCHCGNEWEAVGKSISSGTTRSCGCSKGGTMTHGYTVGRKMPVEYNTWMSMIERCEAPNGARFADYGGRGIYVCDGWRTSFEAFLADMGKRPSNKDSIDRADNGGGYTCGHCEQCIGLGRPMNCRWATQVEQSRNMRSNVLLEYGGRKLCIAEWAEETGIGSATIGYRVKHLGWSHEAAITTPVGPSGRRRNKPAIHGHVSPTVAVRRPGGGKKLTPDEVCDIKRRLALNERRVSIAQVFGVTATTIGYIARGELWSHVEASSETTLLEGHE